MKRRIGLIGATLALALPAAVASCDASAGGPEIYELGIFADNALNRLDIVTCVKLPVLQGSQVDGRARVNADVEVVTEATRSGVTLTFFEGSREIDSRFVSADELRDDFLLDVVVNGSSEPNVRFTSDCANSSGGSGTGGTGGTGGSNGTGVTGGRPGTGGNFSGGTGGVSTGGQPGGFAVSSIAPLVGPYGTEVTIRGQGFGTKAASDVHLSLGGDDVLQVTPSSTIVTAWDSTQIKFRFPFPQEGAVDVDSTDLHVHPGDFLPNYRPGPKQTATASAGAVASISEGPGRISAVLDTRPPTMVQSDGKSWTEIELAPEAPVRSDTIRLYLAADALRGFALTTADPPEIVDFVLSGDGSTFTGTSTGVIVTSTYALAGGSQGAAIWFAESGSWKRVSRGKASWAVDKGPITDPKPGADLHAVVATSDGSLHVVWAEKTGTLLDDTGTPYVQTLLSASSTFGTPAPAGGSVDDFVSTLVAESRGDGFLIRYCGSDVDPFGFSGSEYRCRVSLVTPDGTHSDGSWKDDATSRHTIRGTGMAGLRCDDKAGSQLFPDVKTAAANTAPDIAAWPCPPVLAAELDDDGALQVILRSGSSLFSPRPQEP
jgi:hypothetical protein